MSTEKFGPQYRLIPEKDLPPLKADAKRLPHMGENLQEFVDLMQGIGLKLRRAEMIHQEFNHSLPEK